MRKKLKDITIGEFQTICSNQKTCSGCPFEYFGKCDSINEIDYGELEDEFEIKEEEE